MMNSYSRVWFELFLETRPYTKNETAFVERNLPNPPYQRVLDLCCGEGRHTNILARNGYEMVGVDLDTEALSIAAKNSIDSVKYLEKDMRELKEIPGNFDAIISLWQSFGYFDEITNRDIIMQVSNKLANKGRFIIDLYNREYWAKNEGKDQYERKGVKIKVENKMIGNRLRSSLVYGNGLGSDVFEWQLYSLEEIRTLGKECNLHVLFSCTDYEEIKPVTLEKPMMQIVFEKRGGF